MSLSAPILTLESKTGMHAKSLRNAVVLLFLLLVVGFLQSARAQTSPLTIRLAGDEWFLDSLTKTGLISEFEHKNGVHVEVLHKNDRTIMGDLDRGSSRGDTLDVIVVRHRLLGELVRKKQVQPIDSFLSDSTPCTIQPLSRRGSSFPTGGANLVHTMATLTDIPTSGSRRFFAIAKIC